MTYENAEQNRAYIDGYVKARQADGMDWAIARVKLNELEEVMENKLAAKDNEIKELKAVLHATQRTYEEKILDLESQIEAHRIAWRHRNEAK